MQLNSLTISLSSRLQTKQYVYLMLNDITTLKPSPIPHQLENMTNNALCCLSCSGQVRICGRCEWDRIESHDTSVDFLDDFLLFWRPLRA